MRAIPLLMIAVLPCFSQALHPKVYVFGDSRVSNGGGIGGHTGSSTYNVTSTPGGNFSACLPIALGNTVYFGSDWNFGVGAQSTAGFRSRYATSSFANSGGTASSFVGAGGSIKATDNYFNTATTQAYSSLSYPSNSIVYMGGTNDNGSLGPASPAQKQSMLNTAALLDAWGSAGKTVFLSNELPAGVATAYRETYTVPGGGGAYTATHAADYLSTVYVSYAPAPGAANDGTVLTKVVGALSAGQYSVSAGVFTFAAADAGAVVAIDYAYAANGKTAGNVAAHIALHNWLGSSASNFVDPSSSVDYGMPGALYQRAWVVPVDTWATIADGSQTALAYNLPNTLYDGLHPSLHGCTAIAAAYATAMQSHYATDYASLPTGTDSAQLISGYMLHPAGFGSVTSISGCTGNCVTQGNLTSANSTGKPAVFFTSMDSATNTQLGSGAMKMDISIFETSTDGYPEMVIKISGTTGANFALNFSQPSGSNLATGTQYRAGGVIKVDVGPNGHLYGLDGVTIKASCTAAAGTSFTPNGESASWSNGAGSAIYAGSTTVGVFGTPFTDADVAGGELRMPILTPPCDTTGMTGTPTGAFLLSIGAAVNAPISATVRVSRLSLKAYTDSPFVGAPSTYGGSFSGTAK